jgi:hypothetical protein
VALASEQARGTPIRVAKELARRSIQTKYDVYLLDIKGTPNGYCPVLNHEQKSFCSKKFYQIEQQRDTENKKDFERHLEFDRDCLPQHNDEITEPMPNPNHTYC